MCERDVLRFLRYYYAPIVDFAIDLAGLSDVEREAVELCGRRQMTIQAAAEYAAPQVSTNTMQARWSSARKRLCRAWSCIEWVQLLADTVD